MIQRSPTSATSRHSLLNRNSSRESSSGNTIKNNNNFNYQDNKESTIFNMDSSDIEFVYDAPMGVNSGGNNNNKNIGVATARFPKIKDHEIEEIKDEEVSFKGSSSNNKNYNNFRSNFLGTFNFTDSSPEKQSPKKKHSNNNNNNNHHHHHHVKNDKSGSSAVSKMLSTLSVDNSNRKTFTKSTIGSSGGSGIKNDFLDDNSDTENPVRIKRIRNEQRPVTGGNHNNSNSNSKSTNSSPGNGSLINLKLKTTASILNTARIFEHAKVEFSQLLFNIAPVTIDQVKTSDDTYLEFSVEEDRSFTITTIMKELKYSIDDEVERIYKSSDALLVQLKNPRDYNEVITEDSSKRYTQFIISDIQGHHNSIITYSENDLPEVELTSTASLVDRFNGVEPKMPIFKKAFNSLASRRGPPLIRGTKIGTPAATIQPTPTSPLKFYSNSKSVQSRTRSKDASDSELMLHNAPAPQQRRRSKRQSKIIDWDDDEPKAIVHTDDFKQLTFRFKDRSSITISVSDYCCLYDNQWINDSLIDFFLKYAVEKAVDKKRLGYDDAYVLTTYFFTKMLSAKPDTEGKRNYYGPIRRWLAKLNLFKYKYIIMPINEYLHWYCVVIYNFKGAIESIEEYKKIIETKQHHNESQQQQLLLKEKEMEKDHNSDDTNDFTFFGETTHKKIIIYYFDSLSQKHENIGEPIIESLIGYAKDVLSVDLTPDMFELRRAFVPKQKNFNDCGIHVIYNIFQFLENDEECLKLWSQGYNGKKNILFNSIFVKNEREKLRTTLREELCHLESKQEQVPTKPNDDDDHSDNDIEIVQEDNANADSALLKKEKSSGTESSLSSDSSKTDAEAPNINGADVNKNNNKNNNSQPKSLLAADDASRAISRKEQVNLTTNNGQVSDDKTTDLKIYEQKLNEQQNLDTALVKAKTDSVETSFKRAPTQKSSSSQPAFEKTTNIEKMGELKMQQKMLDVEKINDLQTPDMKLSDRPNDQGSQAEKAASNEEEKANVKRKANLGINNAIKQDLSSNDHEEGYRIFPEDDEDDDDLEDPDEVNEPDKATNSSHEVHSINGSDYDHQQIEDAAELDELNDFVIKETRKAVLRNPEASGLEDITESEFEKEAEKEPKKVIVNANANANANKNANSNASKHKHKNKSKAENLNLMKNDAVSSIKSQQPNKTENNTKTEKNENNISDIVRDGDTDVIMQDVDADIENQPTGENKESFSDSDSSESQQEVQEIEELDHLAVSRNLEYSNTSEITKFFATSYKAKAESPQVTQSKKETTPKKRDSLLTVSDKDDKDDKDDKGDKGDKVKSFGTPERASEFPQILDEVKTPTLSPKANSKATSLRISPRALKNLKRPATPKNMLQSMSDELSRKQGTPSRLSTPERFGEKQVFKEFGAKQLPQQQQIAQVKEKLELITEAQKHAHSQSRIESDKEFDGKWAEEYESKNVEAIGEEIERGKVQLLQENNQKKQEKQNMNVGIIFKNNDQKKRKDQKQKQQHVTTETSSVPIYDVDNDVLQQNDKILSSTELFNLKQLRQYENNKHYFSTNTNTNKHAEEDVQESASPSSLSINTTGKQPAKRGRKRKSAASSGDREPRKASRDIRDSVVARTRSRTNSAENDENDDDIQVTREIVDISQDELYQNGKKNGVQRKKRV